VPEFPGLDTFRGRCFHTARWPEDARPFTGERVGVIGTGSSGVQLIPILAEQAGHLVVFQRTPAYSLPARNRALGPEQERVKADYPDYRERVRWTIGGVPLLPSEVSHLSALAVDEQVRRNEYQRRWEHGGNALTGAFVDLLADPEANRTAAEFVRERIRLSVRDPERARTLTPDYPYGSKRPCIDTGYFDTFNRDNVELVDLRTEPLAEITPGGVRTGRAEYPLDTLILATGFDAFTGALSRIRIVGREGVSLQQRWADGPRAFLGVGVHGFPNMFLITGPGSPSVLSNMVVSIEQHVDWITDLIRYTDEHGHEMVEPSDAAERGWMERVDAVARRTVYHGANSWYTGANVPGKPRQVLPYVGGVGSFRRRCDAVAAAGYRELTFTRSPAASRAS
jgi:cation diffusion facilitator CzcD-associated flavoprotein CzcO